MTNQHETIEREFRADEIKARTRMIVVGLLFLGIVALYCVFNPAHAQTPCTATSATACFDASVKQGPAPIATQLVWSVPGATACTAGGTAAWAGSVPASGTRNLSGITVDMTLTLACTGPGKATLTWSHDGKLTDGTTASLAGFTVLYGATPAALVSTVLVPGGTVRTYDVTQLATGSWSFAVRARDANGAESVNSNVTTLAVAGSSFSGSRIIDVTSVPTAPVLSVTETTAMEIRPSSTGTLIATRIGLVPLGTRCYEDQRTAANVTYNGVPVPLVDLINWPTASVLREAWAKCGA